MYFWRKPRHDAAEIIARTRAGEPDTFVTADALYSSRDRPKAVGARIRYASVLQAALIATLAIASPPAQAQQPFFLVTPDEIGIEPPAARYGWIPFRCMEGPADNFYQGAWYAGQPTALYRSKAYRPYYRYSAYRAVPRTYLCSE